MFKYLVHLKDKNDRIKNFKGKGLHVNKEDAIKNSCFLLGKYNNEVEKAEIYYFSTESKTWKILEELFAKDFESEEWID